MCRAAVRSSRLYERKMSVPDTQIPLIEPISGDHYRATEMLRWLILMLMHFSKRIEQRAFIVC